MSFHGAVLAVLTVLIVGGLLRVVLGPTIWDRLLGLSLISSKIVMAIIVLASLLDRTFVLDIAIVYSLLGFIGSVLVARFLERGKESA
ncbi:MAG: pH regulation protein F [Spirochaetaceae bacterium]|nr:MAG: pH regulation protein F [Spirochaetaceae bacterium]